MPNDPEPPQAWIETSDGRRLPLLSNYRLGRAPDNHVIIDGPKASRHHAAIHAQDESEFWLIDLGSRNGTYCNQQRLIGPMRLNDGDRITLAGATFVFRQPGGKPPHSGTTSAGGVTVTDFKDQNVWLLMADMERFTQLSRQLPRDQLAISVGRWFQDGQRQVTRNHGRISKFLGDGFLACWESTGDTTPFVAETLRGLHRLREDGAVKFRVVVHYGVVTFGGSVHFGEENIIGSDLNFIFRLEDLASELGENFCASASAESLLARHMPTERVEGEHELKGFPGLHRCFRIAWPG